MGTYRSLVTLADANIERVLTDPPLIWQFLAPDSPEAYERAYAKRRRRQRRRFGRARTGMMTRILGETYPEPLAHFDGERAHASLDKAWHGLHFLLSADARSPKDPQRFLLGGGKCVRGINLGYAPSRVHSSVGIRAVDRYPAGIDDATLRGRFNPSDMGTQEIYPDCIWGRTPEEDDALGYLMRYMPSVRKIDAAAQHHGLGLLVLR